MINGKTPFIGHTFIKHLYKTISKRLGLTVGNACRQWHGKSYYLLDLGPNERGISYLRPFALKLLLLTNLIRTISLKDICPNNIITLTPPINTKDELDIFIKKHALDLLKSLFTLCSDNPKTWPSLPPAETEEAVNLFYSICRIELHPYIYKISDNIENQHDDCYVLFLRPKGPFKQWLVENNQYLNSPVDDLSTYNLETLRSTCSAIIIPYLGSFKEADEFFSKNYKKMFLTELRAWCRNERYYPQEITLDLFCQWFDFEYRGTALRWD